MPADAPSPPPESRQPPAAAIALRLAQQLSSTKRDWIFLASSERRAEETARAIAGFLPQAQILHLPAWDCLPYDRAPPAKEVMGQRMMVLRHCLQKSDHPRLLILSPESLSQKLPPADAVRNELLTLETGALLDRDAFEQFALRTGYSIDDRVDEPGEIALRGNVVEIFPADAEHPIRITDSDGSIEAIMRYDPRTQRSLDELTTLELGPASELITGEERHAGDEHRMAEHYGGLVTIFDYLPKARLAWTESAPDRLKQVQEQIAEAYATACDFSEQRKPLPVGDLYIDEQAWAAIESKTKPLLIDLTDLEPVPRFFAQRSPGRALMKFVREQKEAPVVMTGTTAERKRLASLLKRNEVEPRVLEGVVTNLGAIDTGVWLAGIDLDAGFIDKRSGIVVIAAADALGSRLHVDKSDLATVLAPVELRVGDVVVHEDHGVGVLRDLTRVQTDAGEQDTIRLEYHGETTLMVPVTDFGKLWRYGADVDVVSLDRLNTDAWTKKRASVSVEIDEAAKGLAELAQKRLQAKAEVLKAPKAEYNRLAARFPYPETPDQAAAIAAVVDDMASGHPMNRLICGDVGFGKTEIALRAASVAALAGKQVAIVAPTTVLARQHLQSFEKRFAGTDITVGTLSRLNSAAETTATKEALRKGELRVVVATHAIAADDVEIPELGLVIIDEEQRFGAKLKRQVQELARDVHLLSMSATPIPRSLQAAMVGLQDVSIIATPPARRRPIRTFLAPFDAATARTALLREKRRGGQSFVVVPRIEDIEAVRDELSRIVPDLDVVTAHGGLAPKEIDTALMNFANGQGDVLLATNIIESGLDVPRANTMLIWRADRFGLSQLHQLRGRVGRGRTQGIAYLFTNPEEEIAEATRARLSTLEAFDRLGSGFDISARDLELRGAGDLLGEDQAGHVHLIGSALYQRLLERALAEVKGEAGDAPHPAELNIGMAGSIPVDYVPEAVVRINLYARLQRLGRLEDIEDFAGELEDRFGPPPQEVATLLALARIALQAGSAAIERIDAGPLGIALTPSPGMDPDKVAKHLYGKLKSKGERLIYERSGEDNAVAELDALLGL